MLNGQDEEETKKWDRFWFSGSVEDYLCYKSCHREEENKTDCKDGDKKLSKERETFT